MNKTFLIGNLTKDVDLRTTQSGKSVHRSHRREPPLQRGKGRGEKQTDFFPGHAGTRAGEMCGLSCQGAKEGSRSWRANCKREAMRRTV